ncbi:MAG: hypothetical protein WAZ38_03255 [Prolixibacteraceae bacterium]
MNRILIKAAVGAAAVALLRNSFPPLTAVGRAVATPIPNFMPANDGMSAVWVILPAAAAYYLSN